MIAPRDSEIDEVFLYRVPHQSASRQAQLEEWVENAEDVVKKYPVATLVAAASLGLLIGWFLKCRR